MLLWEGEYCLFTLYIQHRVEWFFKYNNWALDKFHFLILPFRNGWLFPWNGQNMRRNSNKNCVSFDQVQHKFAHFNFKDLIHCFTIYCTWWTIVDSADIFICTLLEKQSKFLQYNMKYRGKPGNTWIIPIYFMLYREKSLGQCSKGDIHGDRTEW